ncbi:hypothetical protein, partial [Mycobacterium talmoniae]|uniref:hypothetical protein n=1 Tax=Mycobacterium talmoniae TaxID=1858794 RepID=UPI001058E217
MSDGDNATPGRPRAGDADGDHDRHTGMLSASPGAAPWERWQTPSRYTGTAGARPGGRARPLGVLGPGR